MGGGTDKQKDRQTDTHINAITQPGLGAGPSEKDNNIEHTVSWSWNKYVNYIVISEINILIILFYQKYINGSESETNKTTNNVWYKIYIYNSNIKKIIRKKYCII